MAARIDWNLPAPLQRVLDETPELRDARLVGGCVRDGLLGLDSKDLDFEVLGVTLEALVQALAPWGATDLVGRSFGVILRAMQFAARFDFDVAPETIALCRSLVDTFLELPLERVREEWWKWACRSKRPSRGLSFLQDCGWLSHFPELEVLEGVPQDPEWHPEGDVWTHRPLRGSLSSGSDPGGI